MENIKQSEKTKVKELVHKLEKICDPYGVIPEVVTSSRAKYRPTPEEILEGASTYELDPKKFDSKEVGFAVVLIKNDYDWEKLSWPKLTELKDKILNSDLNVAEISIELAKRE